MSNRMNMLQFTLDDSEQEDTVQSGTMHTQKPLLLDRFQSKSVTRSIFASMDEDQQYQNMVVVKVLKEAYKTEKDTTNIKMIQEIVYEHEVQELNRQQAQKKEQQEDHQENHQEEEHRKEELRQQQFNIESETITAPRFSQRMLDIALSDDSDNDTQGREDSPEDHRQEEVKILPKKPKSPSKNIPQEVESSQLLEGVTEVLPFMRNISLQPVKPGKFLHLNVYRNASGFNNFWPEFEIYFSNGGQRLLHAKKMMGSTTSNYYITTQPGIQSIDNPAFIAKLRGNFSGSLYQVFDNGVNPEKANKLHKARAIQATIKFKSQIMAMQPRSFDIFMLKEGVTYEQLNGVVAMKQLGLDVLYQRNENKDKILHFSNRKPIYSQSFKGFILNFGGRVQKPSIKNFILEDIEEDKREVMMLGKIDEDLYRMDVSCPIPPYIALCVCLANFDSKFLSE